jgi:hypothetical protein
MNKLLYIALVILGAVAIIGLVGIIMLAITDHPIPDALIAITSQGPAAVGALLVNSGGNTVGQAERVTVAPPADASAGPGDGP